MNKKIYYGWKIGTHTLTIPCPYIDKVEIDGVIYNVFIGSEICDQCYYNQYRNGNECYVLCSNKNDNMYKEKDESVDEYNKRIVFLKAEYVHSLISCNKCGTYNEECERLSEIERQKNESNGLL